ncbi:MAG: hypothetical protein Q9217_006167 [Psora testacea]
MDPLSVAASIMGVLAVAAKVTKTLTDFIRKNADAPDAAHSIVADSQELIICLAQLSPLLQGRSNNAELNNRKAAISVEQLIMVTTSCVMAFSELERSLDSFALDQPLSILARMRWAKEESKIGNLLSRVRASTSSLNLFLTIMTCTSVDEIQSSIGHLTTVMHEVLKRNEEIGRRLNKIETGVTSLSRPTASRVKTWPEARDDAFTVDPPCVDEKRYSEPSSPAPGPFQISNSHLDAELRSSRVYARAIHRHWLSSLPTISEHTNTWSCLSGLSLAQISDISIVSLPLSPSELWNPQPYIGFDVSNDQQAEIIFRAIPPPVNNARSSTGTDNTTSAEIEPTFIRGSKWSNTSSTISVETKTSPAHRFTLPRMKLASFRPQSIISFRRRAASIPNTATDPSLVSDNVESRLASRVQQPTKIWLAGSGESGKSTIMKQMRISYADGFSVVEREQAHQTIFSNLLGAFKYLIAEMIDMRMVYKSRESILHKNLIQGANTYTINQDYLVAMKGLWAEESMQHILVRGKGYALYDNLEYFMSRIDQIFSECRVTCDEDILRARLVDSGISKDVFNVHGRPYQLFDASGDRSQRGKWKWLLAEENPHGIVFVASLSAYNSCLLEDTTVNQFDETTELFKFIVERPETLNVPIIILLNKTDSFKARIGRTVKNQWPDYMEAEGRSYDAMLNFLRNKLLSANECRSDIHVFSLCALDLKQVTKTMQKVFTIVEEARCKRGSLPGFAFTSYES